MPKRNEVAFVADALALETAEALSAGTLGFYGRVFCQCSLPYQDPGDLALWTREAGRLSLSVQPAVVRDPTSGALVARYPYGTLPRLLLLWLSTETVRTRERRLVLGDSTSRRGAARERPLRRGPRALRPDRPPARRGARRRGGGR